MTTRSIGKAKLTTKDGRTRVTPTPSYDVSKTRRLVKSKKRTVVSPRKARAAR